MIIFNHLSKPCKTFNIIGAVAAATTTTTTIGGGGGGGFLAVACFL